MANVAIFIFAFYFVLHGHFFVFLFFHLFSFIVRLLHVPACCYFVAPHWSFFYFYFLMFHFFHNLYKAWLASALNNSVILGLK